MSHLRGIHNAPVGSASINKHIEGYEKYKGPRTADAACLFHKGASLQLEVRGLVMSRGCTQAVPQGADFSANCPSDQGGSRTDPPALAANIEFFMHCFALLVCMCTALQFINAWTRFTLTSKFADRSVIDRYEFDMNYFMLYIQEES